VADEDCVFQDGRQIRERQVLCEPHRSTLPSGFKLPKLLFVGFTRYDKQGAALSRAPFIYFGGLEAAAP